MMQKWDMETDVVEHGSVPVWGGAAPGAVC